MSTILKSVSSHCIISKGCSHVPNSRMQPSSRPYPAIRGSGSWALAALVPIRVTCLVWLLLVPLKGQSPRPLYSRATGRRLALVIGNNDYLSLPKLHKAVNDGRKRDFADDRVFEGVLAAHQGTAERGLGCLPWRRAGIRGILYPLLTTLRTIGGFSKLDLRRRMA